MAIYEYTSVLVYGIIAKNSSDIIAISINICFLLLNIFLLFFNITQYIIKIAVNNTKIVPYLIAFHFVFLAF